MSREREEGGQAACQPGIARKCPFFAVYPGHRRGVGQQNSRAETETVSDSIDATYKQKAGPAFALCAAARQAVGIERLLHDCDRLSTLTEGDAQGLNKRAAGGSPCIAPGKGLG
jgi:hypothetical protein